MIGVGSYTSEEIYENFMLNQLREGKNLKGAIAATKNPSIAATIIAKDSFRNRILEMRNPSVLIELLCHIAEDQNTRAAGGAGDRRIEPLVLSEAFTNHLARQCKDDFALMMSILQAALKLESEDFISSVCVISYIAFVIKPVLKPSLKFYKQMMQMLVEHNFIKTMPQLIKKGLLPKLEQKMPEVEVHPAPTGGATWLSSVMGGWFAPEAKLEPVEPMLNLADIVNLQMFEIIGRMGAEGTALEMIVSEGPPKNETSIADLLEEVKLLLSYGARLDLKSSGGWSVLKTIARSSYADEVLPLLAKLGKLGSDLIGQPSSRMGAPSALEMAIRASQFRAAQILVEHGANVDVSDITHRSALHLAVRDYENVKVKVDALAMLLESMMRSASFSASLLIEANIADGKTMLHGAAQIKEIAELILKRVIIISADPAVVARNNAIIDRIKNDRDHTGASALDYAMLAANFEFLNYLQENTYFRLSQEEIFNLFKNAFKGIQGKFLDYKTLMNKPYLKLIDKNKIGKLLSIALSEQCFSAANVIMALYPDLSLSLEEKGEVLGLLSKTISSDHDETLNILMKLETMSTLPLTEKIQAEAKAVTCGNLFYLISFYDAALEDSQIEMALLRAIAAIDKTSVNRDSLMIIKALDHPAFAFKDVEIRHKLLAQALEGERLDIALALAKKYYSPEEAMAVLAKHKDVLLHYLIAEGHEAYLDRFLAENLTVASAGAGSARTDLNEEFINYLYYPLSEVKFPTHQITAFDLAIERADKRIAQRLLAIEGVCKLNEVITHCQLEAVRYAIKYFTDLGVWNSEYKNRCIEAALFRAIFSGKATGQEILVYVLTECSKNEVDIQAIRQILVSDFPSESIMTILDLADTVENDEVLKIISPYVGHPRLLLKLKQLEREEGAENAKDVLTALVSATREELIAVDGEKKNIFHYLAEEANQDLLQAALARLTDFDPDLIKTMLNSEDIRGKKPEKYTKETEAGMQINLLMHTLANVPFVEPIAPEVRATSFNNLYAFLACTPEWGETSRQIISITLKELEPYGAKATNDMIDEVVAAAHDELKAEVKRRAKEVCPYYTLKESERETTPEAGV